MDPVDDNRNYKFGVFYFNPQDDRRIVPKRMRPFGFTINFAHIDATLLLAGVVLLFFILTRLAEAYQ